MRFRSRASARTWRRLNSSVDSVIPLGFTAYEETVVRLVLASKIRKLVKGVCGKKVRLRKSDSASGPPGSCTASHIGRSGWNRESTNPGPKAGPQNNKENQSEEPAKELRRQLFSSFPLRTELQLLCRALHAAAL